MPQHVASELPMLGVAGSLLCTSGKRRVELVGRESVIEANFNFMPWTLRHWKLSKLPKPLDRVLITWWLVSAIAVHVNIHGRHVATVTPGADSHYHIRYHWGSLARAMIGKMFSRNG